MEVLVTGSTGLLGTNLIHALRDSGHTPIAVARDEAKARRVLPAEVRVVVGDIESPESIARHMAGVDAVVHAAAYFREYARRPGEEARLQQLNVDAPVALYRAADAAGVRRFVFVSSSGTIGPRADGAPSDETTPPGEEVKRNLYFGSKVRAEAALNEARKETSLVHVLPGWMFGPHDSGPTGAGEILSTFLKRGRHELFEGFATVVDARDVANGIVAALERGRDGERYALAGHPSKLSSIWRAMERAAGRGRIRELPFGMVSVLAHTLEIPFRLLDRPNPIPPNGIDILRNGHPISSAKARRELGATFRPLDETMRDAVAYFRELKK